jgi:hypothetical protein
MASQCKQYFCFNKPLPKEEALLPAAIDKVTTENIVAPMAVEKPSAYPVLEIDADVCELANSPFNIDNSYLF